MERFHFGRLIVSLDQVAFLREARQSLEPDPVQFGLDAEMAGAGGLRAHYRIDRRHIQERDVELIGRMCKTRFYLQLSPNQDIVHVVNQLRPQFLILGAERRDELATETGLDVSLLASQLLQIFRNIDTNQTRIFVMIDPDFDQIRTAAKLEIHGVVLNVRDQVQAGLRSITAKKMAVLSDAVKLSAKYGLETHLSNSISLGVLPYLAQIPGVDGIHVGHHLVARALHTGVSEAVKQFAHLVDPNGPKGVN
ncbi:MAG: pyridoxine 5'-phosphate synthase [Acidobacteria bacterium]|nr:pyridoxine 5'-phosphate synthase [Acidobacteriota bacterium]